MAFNIARAKRNCLFNYRHNKPLIYILTIVFLFLVVQIYSVFLMSHSQSRHSANDDDTINREKVQQLKNEKKHENQHQRHLPRQHDVLNNGPHKDDTKVKSTPTSAKQKVGEVNSGPVWRPLGVHPLDAHIYLEAKTSGVFHCINDSSKTMNFGLVNDDFCDCQDGSDEPGTSACVDNVRFYCSNHAHQAPPLKSSAVGDGICDCCDGSDEWTPEGHAPLQTGHTPLCLNRCKDNTQSHNDKFEALKRQSNFLSTYNKKESYDLFGNNGAFAMISNSCFNETFANDHLTVFACPFQSLNIVITSSKQTFKGSHFQWIHRNLRQGFEHSVNLATQPNIVTNRLAKITYICDVKNELISASQTFNNSRWSFLIEMSTPAAC